MTERAPSISRLIGVYATLLCLLASTAAATLLPSGWWSTPIGLFIALSKAFLIAYFFMNLRGQPGIVRTFAVAGLFWLLIMMVLTGSDYLTRAWPG
jgi:cytochrome c oxidase subunit IV